VSKTDICDILEVRRLSDTVGGVKLFIVGQLETDSSKGTILCRVWDCLQLRAVKTPNTFLRAWPDRVFFFDFKKNKAFFSKGVTLLLTLLLTLYILWGCQKVSIIKGLRGDK
jgi:hypothetical protein